MSRSMDVTICFYDWPPRRFSDIDTHGGYWYDGNETRLCVVKDRTRYEFQTRDIKNTVLVYSDEDTV